MLFFLGRYTSYREDQRKGMKEINDNFYRPFITKYNSLNKGYATWTSGLPLDEVGELVELLITYKECCSPFLARKIDDFTMIYSGYSLQIKAGKEITDEENRCIEDCFVYIYGTIEKQLKINSRKLYCSLPKRCLYWVVDTVEYLKRSFYRATFRFRCKDLFKDEEEQ